MLYNSPTLYPGLTTARVQQRLIVDQTERLKIKKAEVIYFTAAFFVILFKV